MDEKEIERKFTASTCYRVSDMRTAGKSPKMREFREDFLLLRNEQRSPGGRA